MKQRRNRAPWRALCGLACAIGYASLALATPAPTPPVDSTLDHAADAGDFIGGKVVVPPVGGGGDEGGIAGTTVIFDNGPFNTGEALAKCTPPGTRSTVQNVAPICLSVSGFNVTAFRGLDNFTITQCADINRVTLYAIEAAATTVPSITGGSVTLHSGQPWATTSNVVATSSVVSEPPSLTTIYRASTTTGTPCIRPVQQLVLDTSAWPTLPPGTYWISWNITGPAAGPPAGYFSPPVTILGMQGAPGANAFQSSSTAVATTWNPLRDTGLMGCVPSPASVPQDWPFVLRGVLGGCAPCDADTNVDGTVDVDDLIAVILGWGPCPGCAADVNGDGVVDVDDLIAVILGWGPCAGPPAPPVSTGACCNGGTCSVGTYEACFNSGGIYFGDGSNCSITNGCAAPANDECTTATTVALGNTSFSTLLATNSALAIAFLGCPFEFSRDVWFSFQSVSGQSYTIDTVLSPVDFDTVLVVYNSTDCPNLGAGNIINCNDDAAAGTLLSSLTVVGDGNVWRIRVGTFVANAGDTASGGNITLRIASP